MLGPATVSADLKDRILKVGESWGVYPADVATDSGAWSTSFVPDARIWSRYDPGEAGPLRCLPPSTQHSPWEDRWMPEADDERVLEQRLREDRARCEQWSAANLRERAALPIAEARERLLSTIRDHHVTLVAAETGSGKSTQVPQYILDDAIDRGEGVGCHVVCTQPRRLAAVSLAARVGWERGTSYCGNSVGHVVRWDEQPPRPWGSIVFCTVGSLLPRIRKLGASHIVVDEAHTRDVHTDLLLTVLLEVLQNSKHLRVLIMSATCNIAKLHEHFSGKDFKCAVVEASGRPHQVKEYFLEDIVTELSWRPGPVRKSDAHDLPRGVWEETDCNRAFEDGLGRYPPETAEVVRSLDEHLLPLHLVVAVLHWVARMEELGSVLVFLPGWQEINACDALLRKDPRCAQVHEVIRLHSTVPPAEQQRAFWPSRRGMRKVILSTDIAETSVTIPDVICVVDTGVARVKMHTSLEVRWASQANLIQRCGRAGRVRDGLCVRLFTRARFGRLDLEPTPEMKRVPIEEVVLSVCDLGLDSASSADYHRLGASAGVSRFLARAPDPPDEAAVQDAFWELQHVGALDDRGFLTHLGQLLARLPLEPAQGAALLLGGLLGAPQSASHVMAATAGREPWARRGKNSEDPPAAIARFARGMRGEAPWSDFFATANALEAYVDENVRNQDRFCSQNELHPAVMQQMWSARRQLSRTLQELGCGPCSNAQGDGGTGGTATTLDDTLSDSWPLMQTMLVFASGWCIGEFDGGRKVNAGFSRPARLAKNCVFCSGALDEEGEPPSKLLAYAELASGTGGRVLRGATMVTPHQMLLFGGRDGPVWDNGFAMFDRWLHVAVDFETGVALGVLRAVTKHVLQYAAKRAMECWSGQANFCEDEWLQEWRACVHEVAQAPLPPKICLWDFPARSGRSDSARHARELSPWKAARPADSEAPAEEAWHSQELAQWAVTTSPQSHVSQEVQPVPAVELPIGWSEHSDDFGRPFFSCDSAGRTQWERPVVHGPDGSAASWRWILCIDGTRRYIKESAGHDGDCPPEHRVHPPDVADGCVLPRGWTCTWDPARKRHYYWTQQSAAFTTWSLPQHSPPPQESVALQPW